MLDDEMTEAMVTSTEAEYRRATEADAHDESIACAQAYIRALEAQVFMLQDRARRGTLALMAFSAR